MTRIVHRCPFFSEETIVRSPTGDVQVVAYQIIVWVSLQIRGVFSQPFPAILDTGHSHNLSIGEKHLLDWTGNRPGDLRTIGEINLNNRLTALKRAEVALCANVPGERRLLAREPYLLATLGGITVLASADPLTPRLPLLGMRAIVRSKLRTTIDGRRGWVTIGKGLFS
ncbi:MAG: hypothetical protein WD278_05590 [Pirellulales bacterium]